MLVTQSPTCRKFERKSRAELKIFYWLRQRAPLPYPLSFSLICYLSPSPSLFPVATSSSLPFALSSRAQPASSVQVLARQPTWHGCRGAVGGPSLLRRGAHHGAHQLPPPPLARLTPKSFVIVEDIDWSLDLSDRNNKKKGSSGADEETAAHLAMEVIGQLQPPKAALPSVAPSGLHGPARSSSTTARRASGAAAGEARA